MRIALLTVLAVALGLAAAPPPGAPPTRTLDDCDAAARDHPKDLPSYLCYWLVARRQKAWPDAARRLDARLALEPDNHLAQLYLGLVELDQRHDRGKDLLVSAADGLEKEKNWTGAVYANISLEIYNQIRRDLPAAEPYLVRAERAAQA